MSERLHAIRERLAKATPNGHVHERECDLRGCVDCWAVNRAKWNLAANAPGDIQYLLNALDRSTGNNDPHSEAIKTAHE